MPEAKNRMVTSVIAAINEPPMFLCGLMNDRRMRGSNRRKVFIYRHLYQFDVWLASGILSSSKSIS